MMIMMDKDLFSVLSVITRSCSFIVVYVLACKCLFICYATIFSWRNKHFQMYFFSVIAPYHVPVIHTLVTGPNGDSFRLFFR